MLKFLRARHIQKRIFLILALVIIPPFVFWGVIVGKEEGAPTALGTLDGRKITVKDYLDSYRALHHQMQFVYGRAFNQMAGLVNFKGEAWDRLLLLHYARKEKISVSDQEVVEWLASQPVFFNRGRFDTQFYKRYVDNFLRTTTRQFEEEIRQVLVISKINDRIRSKISVQDEEIKKIYTEEKLKQDPKWMFDEKKFEEEKSAFREKVLDEKTSNEMTSLLEQLRKDLIVNTETMRKLFQDEKPNEAIVT